MMGRFGTAVFFNLHPHGMASCDEASYGVVFSSSICTTNLACRQAVHAASFLPFFYRLYLGNTSLLLRIELYSV
ncbi:hypothetical protein BJY04DRAFT_194879 [Aspergillus karnatakaensis]|uniref:uncharacterized protein n=1 Tax=Aspergillus karnatakaensis TaxID=1810916 RepID=UPI003CCCFB24